MLVVKMALAELNAVATIFVEVALDAFIVPTLIFVFTRFVDVMFVVVRVPEIPILPPVIIVVEIRVDATVPIEP